MRFKKKLFLLFFFIPILQISFSQTLGRVIKVQDGDTYELENGDKVRMIGINAPELHNSKIRKEPFAEESQGHLQLLILNKVIKLEKDSLTKRDKDKYGRLLRYTFLDGVDIDKKMIVDGYALAYLNYPFTKRNEYILAQNDARENKKGFWKQKESPNTGSEKKQKKQTKTMGNLLSIILLISITLLLGGVFYYYKFYYRPPKPIAESIKIVESYSLNDNILKEYIDLGRMSATQKLADTGSLRGELDTVYSKYQDYTSTNKGNRISSLEQMISNTARQNTVLEGEIERYNLSKEQTENNIEESRKNRNTLLSEGAQTGIDLWIKFSVLIIICLGLLAFLYSIYTTAFYEVFYGKGSKNLLTGFDFSNLDELGNMSKISVICFPLLFLAISILIDIFSKNKNRYITIILLALITFSVDFILALLNAKKNYTSEFLNGLTTDKFSIEYWSSNLYFWIFIFTATAGYIIWGIIFHNLLLMAKKIQQPEMIKEQLKNIDDKLVELQEKRINFSQKIRTAELDKENNNKIIKEIENNLALIKNGAIVVIWSELLGVVGKFMSGWNNFVKFYYTNETESKLIIEKSEFVKGTWLKEKENSKQFNSIK